MNSKSKSFAQRRYLAVAVFVLSLVVGLSSFAERVTDGLQVLYLFDEGSGTNVQDVSGMGSPLDLTVQNESAIQWLIGGGLKVNSETVVKSVNPATNMVSACQATNEITVEAWIKPADTEQSGPARIVTLSADIANRNFTLGQEGSIYDFLLRTTTTGNNGSNPEFFSQPGDATAEQTHVVVTRDSSSNAVFYINGSPTSTMTISGDLSNWDSGYFFALANELTGSQKWLGEYYLVAVYARALSSADVLQNYNSGGPSEEVPPDFYTHPLDTTVTEPAAAIFTVTAGGTAPLYYQWRRDGSNIVGATTTTHTVSPTSLSDNGAQFDVVVSNAFGVATSQVAVLTVNEVVPEPPVITDPPQDVEVTEPEAAPFNVTATGTEPLYYTWRRDGITIPGAIQSWYLLDPTAVEDDGTEFDVVVSNAYGVATSQVAVLTVNEYVPQPPSITGHPEDATTTEPAPASFSVTATGDIPLSFQWRRDDVPIPGASSTLYTLDPTSVDDDGALFDVVVSNAYGVVTSQVATLTVNPPPVPPGITEPPQDITVTEGDAAGFNVTATGTAPLAYQWRRNGTPIVGAVAADYMLDPALLTDNGAQFDVVVANAGGSVTSAVAILTVEAAPIPPAITLQPSDRTVTEPAGATFSVRAMGDPPLSYQWYRDHVIIVGATAWDYTIDPTSVADNGVQFYAVVSSPVGVATSDVATLTVTPTTQPPVVTLQPADRTVTEPDQVIFSVRATGDPVLTYQWRRDGTNVPGATAWDYVLSPTDYATDSGAQFDAVVSNDGGSVTSEVAVLTVEHEPVPPAITLHPSDVIVMEPDPAAFSVTATGDAPLFYQWWRDQESADGATNSTCVVDPTDAAADDGSQFLVVVSNQYGTVTSSVATLTVNAAPGITSQPDAVTVVEPAAATFSVQVSGSSPLALQWRRDGGDIAGETNTVYLLDPTHGATDDGTQFSVVVSNPYGSVTSSPALLTVLMPPVITQQPEDVAVQEPDPAPFSVSVVGLQPMSCQWRRDGIPIGGETNTDYTLDHALVSDDGAGFDVVIQNDDGIVTSRLAILTVAPPPTVVIDQQPVDQTVFEPEGATFSVVAHGGAVLSYQWRRDGQALPGAIGSSYNLATTDADTDNGAAFDVVVADGFTVVTSQTAWLSVYGDTMNLLLAENGGELESYTSELLAGFELGSASNLTDGVYSGANWNDIWVSSVYPGEQEFVYSLAGGGSAIMDELVIHNYGEGIYSDCYSRDFSVYISEDGESYTHLFDGELAAVEGEQRFSMARAPGRFFKLVVSSGYNPVLWEMAEVELFGWNAALNDHEAPTEGMAAAPESSESIPIALTYGDVADTGGSGLKEVALWFKKDADGTWTDSGLRETSGSGSFQFSGMTGDGTYYFDLQSEDNVGNFSPAPSGSGDCSTAYTTPLDPINVLLPVNGGVLESYTSQYAAQWGAANLTDGETGAGGFWVSSAYPANPQEFVWSFAGGQLATFTEVVIHNYGQGVYNRYSRGYRLEVSNDGVNFSTVETGELPASEDAQVIDPGDACGRYLKLALTSGYNAGYWELGEVEAYARLSQPEMVPPVAGTAQTQATATNDPIIVTYSGAADDQGGSGLKDVALWFKKEAGGAWTDSGLRETGGSGSFEFSGMTGDGTYYFDLVASDNAGNLSPEPSGSGDCSTLYDGPPEPVNVLLPANGGVLESYTSQYAAQWGAANLTDGETGAGGFWISAAYPANPQEFVWSFAGGQLATFTEVVIHNYGQGVYNRYSRGYRLEVSNDGVNFSTVETGELPASEDAQVIDPGDACGRYLKLAMTSGYNAGFWELGEVEAYARLSQPEMVPPVAGTAQTQATATNDPIIVTYSGAADDQGGSGLKDVALWFKKEAGGAWTDSGLRETGGSGSFEFSGMTGDGTYYFDLVASDNAGNLSPEPSGSGDCSTLYDGPPEPVNVLLPANGGVLESYTSQYAAQWGAANLTDGETGAGGFWISAAYPANPQEFVWSFAGGQLATFTEVVIHNYGQGVYNRYSRGYRLEVSNDGVNFSTVETGELPASEDAQVIDPGDACGRYLKLALTSGYDAGYWELGEVEAYARLSQPETVPPVAGTAQSPATATNDPIVVIFSGAADDQGGSGLKDVALWFKKEADGTWTDSGLRCAAASGVFAFTNLTGDGTYYFDLVASDNAGNLSPAPSGSGDCSTLYDGPPLPMNVLLPANGGVLEAYTSQYDVQWGAANLTDGETGAGGFWISAAYPANPQEFVWSFAGGQMATFSEVVIHNYGQGVYNRYSRGYRLEVSNDGVNFSTVETGELPASEDAQVIDPGDACGRYLKLALTSGYNAAYWELGEVEAHGILTYPEMVPPVAGTAQSPATATNDPIIVTYSGAADDQGGSGLKDVALWFKKEADGTWTDSGLRETGGSGSFAFNGMTGSGTYYFDLVAQDNVGNLSPVPSGSGDCSTAYTAPPEPVNVLLPANGGILRRYTSEYASQWGGANVTDEETGAGGFWVSAGYPANPQEFVWGFASGQPTTLGELVIYNYGQGAYGRYSKDFEIWVSDDDVNYTIVTTGTLAAQVGAQVFDLGGVQARYVKLAITSGYNPYYWELGEVEIYGYVPWPHVWASGEESPEFGSGNLTDSNTDTVWRGDAGGAPWDVTMDFGQVMSLNNLDILFEDEAWANTEIVGSADGEVWFDILTAEDWPISCRYVYIQLAEDQGQPLPPAIREILWEAE